jgi:opacity protein-like surface antigen
LFVTRNFQNGNHSKTQRIKSTMKVNSALFRLIFISSLAGGCAFAQFPLSIGVKGGVGLTDAFTNTTQTGVDLSSQFQSTSKDYIVGPMIELRLPLHLAFEVDALYRPLNLTTTNTVTGTGTFTGSQTYNSWEFPLLLKYRFATGRIAPYIEAGPSYRRTDFPSSFNQLNNAGFTAGAGLEFHALHVRVAPEVRYTRWGGDTGAPFPTGFTPSSQLNQVELLFGFSY